jgi:hypothetical protein
LTVWLPSHGVGSEGIHRITQALLSEYRRARLVHRLVREPAPDSTEARGTNSNPIAMRKLLISLMLVLAHAGCGALSPIKQAGSVPAWVLSPPADSREWFWGVGEGAELDAARRAGLKDIAARLRVGISGRMESQVTVDNGKVDRQARTWIAEEVQKTEFSHYVVEKTARSADGFFVLVKLDRQAFIRSLKDRLGVLDAHIRRSVAGLDRQTPLERFVSLRRIQPDLEQATGYAQLLVGAEAEGMGADRLRDYEALWQQARQAATMLVFHIQSRPEDQDLAEAVGIFLNESGIRVEAFRGGGNTLVISSGGFADEIYGSKLVKLKVTLSVRDDADRALAGRTYEISGSSAYDYSGARKSALRKLLAAMREAGPATALGFAE